MSDERYSEERRAVEVGASLGKTAVKGVVKGTGKLFKVLPVHFRIAGVVLGIILFLMTVLLYSFPSSVYSNLQYIFGYTEEDWSVIRYRYPAYEEGVMEETDLKFKGGLSALRLLVIYGVKDLNDIETSPLTQKLTDEEKEDLMAFLTLPSAGVRIMGDESAMKDIIEEYVQVAAEKLNARMSQLFQDIRQETKKDNEDLEALLTARFNDWVSERRSQGDDREYTFDGDYRISVARTPVTVKNGIELLCLYAAQKGNSPMMISGGDFYRYLGCYYASEEKKDLYPKPSFSLYDSIYVKESFYWFGGCLPQYLEEQRQYEIKTYGKVVSDFSSYEVPAVDIAVYIDAPDLWTLVPTVNEDGEASFMIPIRIKMRDPESISAILGLTGGEDK